MAFATIGSFRDLVEISVTGVSILGGAMAYCSGKAAYKSMRIEPEYEAGQIPLWINEGLADGFRFGLPLALVVATLLAWI